MNLKKIIALLLSAVFLIVGLMTLPDYNVNWDSVNHLLRGQAYIHFFLNGKKTYSDLPAAQSYYQPESKLFFSPQPEGVPRRSVYQIDGYDFNRYIQKDGGHPPLSDILSSFSNYIFFQKLGLINDIDAYHLYGIFLASFLIFILFIWVANNYSLFTAFIASLSLILYPLFFGEAHFNTEKDVPETVFFALTIIFFHQGIAKKNWKWIILSSIFCGLAWGTKFNIVFAPFIILPWLLICNWRVIKSLKWPFSRKITLSFIFYPVLPILIFFGPWPFLWYHPFVNFLKIFSYYKIMGLVSGFDSRYLTAFKFNTYPIQYLLFTVPLVILFFSSLGVVYFFSKGRQEKNKTTFLILLWLLVPVIRVSVPGTGIYGGIRQIMELIPAMAILAGVGADWLKGFLLKYFRKEYLVSSILTLAFLPITFKLISIHPNENVYFNPLIGGLNGAKERDFLAWGDSFGNPYRQAAIWINKNVEKNANLAFASEVLSNMPAIFLRPDINYGNRFRSGFWKKGEYVFGLTSQGAMEYNYYTRYLEKIIIPIYEVKVDGVPILKVWKNDVAHTRKEFLQEEEIKNPEFIVNEEGLEIDLGGKIKLSRIEIDYDETSCQPIETGRILLSPDGEGWLETSDVLPEYWLFAAIGPQDKGGKWVWAFTGEVAQFVKIKMFPAGSCLKNVEKIKAWSFL